MIIHAILHSYFAFTATWTETHKNEQSRLKAYPNQCCTGLNILYPLFTHTRAWKYTELDSSSFKRYLLLDWVRVYWVDGGIVRRGAWRCGSGVFAFIRRGRLGSSDWARWIEITKGGCLGS